MKTELITWAHLPQRTTLSRTTIKRLRRSGDFPQPIKLSANRLGWYETDITDWLASRRSREA